MYSIPMRPNEIKQIQKTKQPKIQNLSTIKFHLNFRLIVGIILIATSFVSAFLISNSSNRMVTVWSATTDLAPGTIIDETNIEQAKVLLPSNIGLYLDGTNSILGAQVLRGVGAAELIPAYAISSEVVMDLKQVPISIPISRMPFGAKNGDLVDVYALPTQNLVEISGAKTRPGLVLSNIGIDGINLEASKLGGEIGVTLLVPTSLVAKLVSVMGQSDFLLVKAL